MNFINYIKRKLVPNKSIQGIFPKDLFWDVILSNISLERDKEFIIDRVVSDPTYNNYLDILESYYPLDLIKARALRNTQLFSMDDIKYLSKRYGLPLKGFDMYISS